MLDEEEDKRMGIILKEWLRGKASLDFGFLGCDTFLDDGGGGLTAFLMVDG